MKSLTILLTLVIFSAAFHIEKTEAKNNRAEEICSKYSDGYYHKPEKTTHPFMSIKNDLGSNIVACVSSQNLQFLRKNQLLPMLPHIIKFDSKRINELKIFPECADHSIGRCDQQMNF